jgi:hypothetical protein
MAALKGSSLLVRTRRAGVWSGWWRYLRMVRQPMGRRRSILRIGQRSRK